LTFVWPWIVINFLYKNQRDALVSQSIIRSLALYTQQWYMSYRFADSLQAVSRRVLRIPLLCVKWKTPDDGQRNCLKHVQFHSKNKFEKLVHLVGFNIRTPAGCFMLPYWY
jgi:hypothetical protein